MQKHFLYLLIFCLSSTAIAQNTHNQQVAVYFEKDQAELSIEAQNKLTQTLQSILNLESYSVKIEAHTDSDGSLTYNQLLSEKRANSVYEFLLLQGMNTQDLQIVAQGETDPAFSNQTERGQQKNRRVDVFFVSKSTEIQIVKSTPRIFPFKDLQRLTTTNTLQSFSLKSLPKKQKIEARKGTKLTIPPDAFVFEDGSELPPNAEIQIEIQEALSLEDMLVNNLSTMSGNKILETGGMISIEANYQGEKLQLKSGKNIEVEIPQNGVAIEKENEMELFYGTSQENTVLDWMPANESVETVIEEPLIEVDLTELEDFEMPEKPTTKLMNVPGFLKKRQVAKRPKRPISPRKPVKSHHRFRPSDSKKAQYSRAEIAELSEQKYQKALEEYGKQKMDFDRKMEIYWSNLAAFKRKLVRNRKENAQLNRAANYGKKKIRAIETYYHNSWAAFQNFREEALQNGLRSTSPSALYKAYFDGQKNRIKSHEGYLINQFRNYATFVLNHWKQSPYGKYGQDTLQKYDEYYATQQIEELTERLDSAYFEKKLSNMSESERYYYISTNRLGWINIDRWLKNQKMEAVEFITQKNDGTQYFAISHRFNSCLRVNPSTQNNEIKMRLPLGEKFTIIGMNMKGEQFWMASEDFKVDKKMDKIPVSLQKESIAHFKEVLRNIENQRS